MSRYWVIILVLAVLGLAFWGSLNFIKLRRLRSAQGTGDSSSATGTSECGPMPTGTGPFICSGGQWIDTSRGAPVGMVHKSGNSLVDFVCDSGDPNCTQY